jgi:phosphatidylserine/phosphatidylglycerophosphate/cardiolipin synthase-like enzyme
MRKTVTKNNISVFAVAGTRVVLMAINVAPAARPGLLGFAMGRVKANGVDWLKGSKVFQSVIPNPDPEKTFSSDKHPIQSLIWSDLVAKPGTTTTYRVQPMYGPVNAPVLKPGADITVTTEDPDTADHGIYFNFGAIASQAFARNFDSKPPQDENNPDDKEVKWLSRGMLDAALGFIAQAKSGDALHVAAYEFTYEPILLALKAAGKRGVKVHIVHEAGKETVTKKDKVTGEKIKVVQNTSATNSAAKAIKAAALRGATNVKLIKRTKRRNIPHNKFIVWVKNGAAKEVLAGSANFTPSGFIGQTNVVHIVRLPDVAQAYLDYWTELSGDPPTTDLSTWSQGVTAHNDITALTTPPGVLAVFSPRKNDKLLNWFADAIGGAQQTAMFTGAFGVNKIIAEKFGVDLDFVRFLLLEDKPDAALAQKLEVDPDVLAAYGSILGALQDKKVEFPKNSLSEWFLKEELFRKQGNIFFIHTKFLLIDPLTDNPLVVTGSANFSHASLVDNDENILFIRGDKSVADVYVTEFDRIFRHFFARQAINDRILNNLPITESKFLDETGDWLDEYTGAGKWKKNRQRLFFPSWPN